MIGNWKFCVLVCAKGKDDLRMPGWVRLNYWYLTVLSPIAFYFGIFYLFIRFIYFF